MSEPVIIGCEESQVVCAAFRARGIESYSCDIIPTRGNPNWHIQDDVREVIRSRQWGLGIFHPPCTYTSLSGNRWYWNSPLRLEGAALCKEIWELAGEYCNRSALEQPSTIMQRFIGPRSQIIQPYQFGHGETKTTWLWLHNLPLLVPTNVVEGREHRIWKMPPGPNRQRERSVTYQGIADAMADQWR